MGARVIEAPALAFYATAAVVAFFAAALTGVIRKERRGVAFLRGVEAAVLAPLGGFLARLFIDALLSSAGDSPAASFTVGWAFFLWPGVIDVILWLLNFPPVFTAPVLLWTAAVVGAFTGMMDGLWRIHRWAGPGPPAFLLDVTWGLGGTTQACLLHLVNVVSGKHGDEGRTGAHRYDGGFHLKGGYAFTQGNVMSNMAGADPGLLAHERTHVLQNRLFGPVFLLTALGWMALMLIPGLVAGAMRNNPAAGVMDWCYLNNPWEIWAYAAGGHRHIHPGWSNGAATALAVPYFLAAAALIGWWVWAVWFHG